MVLPYYIFCIPSMNTNLNVFVSQIKRGLKLYLIKYLMHGSLIKSPNTIYLSFSNS